MSNLNHLSQEELILLYYREPGVDEAAGIHLDGCPECRDAARALCRVLDSCSEWTVPDPAPDFARGVWARIVPQLEIPAARRRWKWVYATCAVAAVLLLAFLAGRYSQQPRNSMIAGLSPQAQRRILAISLADHLDRAEMLLTEVSNAADTESPDRLRAKDLVEEGRLMRQTLARQGESSTLAMLDEVERFMLEVANAPDRVDAAQLHELRERIASESLLFKVRIIESNLRTEGKRI